MDYGYLTLIVVTLALGLGAQWYVNHMLKKYQGAPVASGITGADCARRMLSYYGISGVAVNAGGHGQDFFDPRTNSVTLSPEAYGGRSVTAIATACHEVGHACQYASGYMPMKVRGSLVPAVNAASNAWMFFLLIGIFLNMVGLVWLAIIMYAAVVVFQLVTLPVEFDASRRAMAYMSTIGMPAAEQSGSAKVLRACAFTYLAAALTSILQLLWLLARTRD